MKTIDDYPIPLPAYILEFCNSGIEFEKVIQYIEENKLSYYYLHWFKGNIPEEYQFKLINEDPRNFLYIINPTEKVIQKAIELDWRLIGVVPIPSRMSQAIAMQKSHQAKHMITYPDLVVDLMDL